MKRFGLLALGLACSCNAYTQSPRTALEVGIRYAATVTNAPPGECGCFVLQGAGMDASYPLASHLRAVVDVAGTTIGRVPETSHGLSEITLLAGPRYVFPMRHFNLNAQALFGAVRGFGSDFILTSTVHTDTSTNFAMTLGGSLDLPLTRTVLLRPIQFDYLQTNLPNGVDNRQRNIRFGAGVIFRVHLPSNR